MPLPVGLLSSEKSFQDGLQLLLPPGYVKSSHLILCPKLCSLSDGKRGECRSTIVPLFCERTRFFLPSSRLENKVSANQVLLSIREDGLCLWINSNYDDLLVEILNLHL